MGVDLLRQQQRWKNTLMDIRHMMASLIQEGFNPSNMRSWRLHWDHQLYKALEHQYQMGLESLNQNLPEIKIELIFRYVCSKDVQCALGLVLDGFFKKLNIGWPNIRTGHF